MIRSRVLVAMSGGVDSSVAAYLLHRDGWEVVGVHMRNGAERPEGDPPSRLRDGVAAASAAEPRGRSRQRPAEGAETARGTARPPRGCCSVEDAYDARRVADRFGFPFHVLNFRAAFGGVMDYFAGEYDRARTPNPCIQCNAWLKFGRLASFARSLGIETVATGHYARLVGGGGSPFDSPGSTPPASPFALRATGDGHGRLAVARPADAAKDQSYVLFPLTQEQLSRACFPLGGLTKDEVRAIAREAGLNVHAKPDSQGICFIPDDDPGRFLRERLGDRVAPGEFRTLDGTVVGGHPGFQLFTIGQRKGLGVSLGRPVYVVRIDPDTNTVYLGDDDDLRERTCEADGVNWMGWGPPENGETRRCSVQIRAHHDAAPASVTVLSAGRVRVDFDAPQRALTPGQAAVFYDGDRVAGGGWIAVGGKRETQPVRADVVKS